MNISEFQFRFLDIAEQIECTSKHSPLNLKETLNYWNILLSHLLELKDEETNSLKILRALEQLHQLLSIEEKNPSFSKNTTQTLTAWLSIEITLCSKNLSVSEKSPAKNNVSPLHWLTKANELLELINSLWYSAKIGAAPGLELSYTGFVRCFEEFFNIKLKKLFDKRSQLSARKRNPTPLLDQLKSTYLTLANKRLQKIFRGRTGSAPIFLSVSFRILQSKNIAI